MTEAMKRGLWGEAAVFAAIEDTFPNWEVRRAKVYFRDAGARLGATPDGAAIIPGLGGITIIQTKVIARPVFERDWRADPDDKFSPTIAPLAYQLQTLTEAMLAEAEQAMIVALVVDTFKWSLYAVPVNRNPPAEARIREMVGSFCRNYLDTGIQPPVDPERDEAIVKALYPHDNGLEIDLSGDNEMPLLVDDLVKARTEKKYFTELEGEVKTAIADKMGTAAIARLADGRRISFKTVTRAGYVAKASTSRVMKILQP
jgi:hypothetical protein